MVALELEAGLPGPLGQQGHVPAHDACAVARPQAAGCRGRTAAGRRARPPLLSPRELTARGEGRGRSPRRGTAGALWGVLGRTHQSKDPDAGSSRSEMPTPHAGAGEPSAGPPHLRRCWRACTCLASAAGTSPPLPPGAPARGTVKPGPAFPARGQRGRKSGPWSHLGVTGPHVPWSCPPLC